MILKKRNKILLIMLFSVYVLCVAAVGIVRVNPENKVKVIYNFELPLDTSGRLILEYADGHKREIIGQLDKETFIHHEIAFEFEGEGLANMVIELHHRISESYVKAIEFYNHGVQVKRLASKEIIEYFDMADNSSYSMRGPYLVVAAQDQMPTIIGKERLEEELQSILGDERRFKTNIIILVTILYLLVNGICIYWTKVMECLGVFCQVGNKCWQEMVLIGQIIWKKRIALAVIALVVIQFFVFLMATKSQIYGHPDENVTRMAIDYYLGGWLKPSANSSWVAGTYSDMGHARLTENTWYYFVAGKIGWIIERLFHFRSYYRMSNVLLFSIVVIMTLRYGRKNKWMYITLMLSPQLWYLYSYATSDAWDFFWGFVIAFEVLKEGSLLNRYLKEKRIFNILPLFVSGLAFSMIFQAKKNYYCILLFVFINLLFRMFPLNMKKLKGLLPKYALILIFTFIIFQFKAVFLDQILIHENSVTENIFNENQYEGSFTSIKDEGGSLKEVIVDKHAARSLLHSFVGRYGWCGSYDVGVRHMFVMLVLYLLFVAILIYNFHWKEKKDIFESFLQICVCMLMVMVVFLYCWTGDFQPQGRYILPITIVLGSICAKNEKVFSNVLFNGIMFLIVLCNLYSFLFIGIKNMVVPYL